MLQCREVSRLIASEDIRHAGLARRLELRLHLAMCRQCRNYARQVGLMGSVARRLWGAESEDPEEIARLERDVLEAAERIHKSMAPADAGTEEPSSN